MKKIILPLLIIISVNCFAQKASPNEDGIKPVGVIKGLSDSALLDVVQRQTFRYSGILRTLQAAWPASAAMWLMIMATKW